MLFRAEAISFDGSPAPRGVGTALVPGCLTGESEERETWTAESLRAASPNEDLCLRGERPDETSAVDVSGQHPVRSGGPRRRCKSRGLERPPRRVGELVRRCA